MKRFLLLKRQSGMTMPEIMLALSLIAIVTAGGIVSYGEVMPRVTANNLAAGLNGFLVDTVQYVQQNHTDQPGGQAEANSESIKNWDAATTGAIDDLSVTCTATGVPHPNCPATLGTINIPSPNLQRFANMPSLRFGEGAYDQDNVAEWHIPVSANNALEVAFSIVPQNDNPFGGGGTNAAATFAPCPIDNAATLPDTAVALQIVLDDKRVCDNLAQAVARMDHVHQAWCLDDETDPQVIPADFGTVANRVGAVALNICLAVQR